MAGSWKIGEVTITRVVDVLMNLPTTFLIPEATPENMAPMASWLQPHFIDADNKIMPLSIHTFVVQSAGKVIVVDTCIGDGKERDAPDWNNKQSNFLEELAAAGAPREAVDYVMCTHLHVDHVGWNTVREGDAWVPTFPKARYLIGRTEWDFWKDEEDPFGKQAKFDSILPIIESDQVDLVESDHRITDEVRLIPTPGHTPGHVSVEITSGGARGVITGDLFHHPCQFQKPFWEDTADVDGPTAQNSRINFMEQFGDETLVLGTHFAAPTAGHIVKDGEFWRFEV